MFPRLIVIPVMVLAATAALAPAASTQPAEQKMMQDRYGQKIAAAKAAGDEARLTLARELLTAAQDSANPARLREALAAAALDVVVSCGSPEAASMAQTALALVDGITPYKPLDKAALLKDIAAAQLAKAVSLHKGPAELASLARPAIKAHLDYIQAALAEGGAAVAPQAAGVDASIHAARQLVSTYKLTVYAEQVDALEKAWKRAADKRAKLQGALAGLKQAEETNDKDLIKTSRKFIALAYIECDGDLAAAAKYIVGTGDPREAAIIAAAAYQADPATFKAPTALATVKALSQLADTLTDTARISVAQCALKMNDAFLASQPDETAATEARLLAIQLQGLVKQPGGRLSERILAVYGNLNGKLETLGDQRVRLTYDFSGDEQLNDWETRIGGWSIVKGVLVCKTQVYAGGEAGLIFRFRPDKPVKMSFTASARNSLGAKLDVRQSGADASSFTYRFRVAHDEGAVADAGNNQWRDDRMKLVDGKPYKLEIVTDGKGGYTWSINGAIVKDFTAARLEPNVLAGELRVCLTTDRSDRAPSGFKDVSVEGDLILDGAGPTSAGGGQPRTPDTGGQRPPDTSGGGKAASRPARPLTSGANTGQGR